MKRVLNFAKHFLHLWDDHVLFTLYSVSVVCVCWTILASQGWIPLGHEVWSFSWAINLVCMWHYSLPLKRTCFCLSCSVHSLLVTNFSGLICLKILFIAFLMKDIYWYKFCVNIEFPFFLYFEILFLLSSGFYCLWWAISHLSLLFP